MKPQLTGVPKGFQAISDDLGRLQAVPTVKRGVQAFQEVSRISKGFRGHRKASTEFKES